MARSDSHRSDDAEPLQVVVVGSNAGGMSAATRLRRYDERAIITCMEQGPHISYANCGLPYALGGTIEDESSLVLQTPLSISRRFNMQVNTDTRVNAINRPKHTISVQFKDENQPREVHYDKLILAQGVLPVKPRIPGIDSDRIFTLHTIPELADIQDLLASSTCRRATVIGAGFIGLEVAEALVNLGLAVTIIDAAPQVFPPFDLEMAKIIETPLSAHGIDVMLNVSVKSFDDKMASHPLVIRLSDGRAVAADLAILAIGVAPNSGLAQMSGLDTGKNGYVMVDQFMRTNDPDIYAVGDMVQTLHRIAGYYLPSGLAGPANRQGRLAADHICHKSIAYRGNVGTSVIKIFDLTAACTGLSLRALRAQGLSPLYVTVHTADHASYYPGATSITLRVIFDDPSGDLLGAQAIGKNGVDKRIDVLSTAIQAGLTIFD